MIIIGNHDHKKYQITVGNDGQPYLYQNNTNMGRVIRIEFKMKYVILEFVNGIRHEIIVVHSPTYLNWQSLTGKFTCRFSFVYKKQANNKLNLK